MTYTCAITGPFLAWPPPTHCHFCPPPASPAPHFSILGPLPLPVCLLEQSSLSHPPNTFVNCLLSQRGLSSTAQPFCSMATCTKMPRRYRKWSCWTHTSTCLLSTHGTRCCAELGLCSDLFSPRRASRWVTSTLPTLLTRKEAQRS